MVVEFIEVIILMASTGMRMIPIMRRRWMKNWGEEKLILLNGCVIRYCPRSPAIVDSMEMAITVMRTVAIENRMFSGFDMKLLMDHNMAFQGLSTFCEVAMGVTLVFFNCGPSIGFLGRSFKSCATS